MDETAFSEVVAVSGVDWSSKRWVDETAFSEVVAVDNKQTCQEMIGHRVKAPHPSVDERTIVGVVVGYDPWPYKRVRGHYVVIRPDKQGDDVCHPPWETVRFDTVTML